MTPHTHYTDALKCIFVEDTDLWFFYGCFFFKYTKTHLMFYNKDFVWFKRPNRKTRTNCVYMYWEFYCIWTIINHIIFLMKINRHKGKLFFPQSSRENSVFFSDQKHNLYTADIFAYYGIDFYVYANQILIRSFFTHVI